MISAIEEIEKVNERPIQEILAALPSLLHPGFTLAGMDMPPPGSSSKIDLLYRDAKGRNHYVEVEHGLVDASQIAGYEKELESEIANGTACLHWAIPSDISGRVALPGSSVCIHRYDNGFYEDFARFNQECRGALTQISGILSRPYQYALGRSLGGGSITFPNIGDALLFYGYATIKDKAGKDKKRKVGPHLGNLGFTLDMIRQLASPGTRIRSLNPSPGAQLDVFYPALTIKLIIDILEAPFQYVDVKGHPGGWVDEDGLINLVNHYKKTGSNWEEVASVFQTVYQTASKHRAQLAMLNAALRDSLVKDGIANFDLLEIVWKSIAPTVLSNEQVHTRTLIKAMFECFGFQNSPKTQSARLSGGQEVHNTRRSSSELPYMGARLVELMTLKGLILPKFTMYPVMQTLRYGVKPTGEVRLEAVPVAEYLNVVDLRLHRETLRSEPVAIPLTREKNMRGG